MDAVNMLQEKLKNPVVVAIIAFVVGLALGLYWAYQVDPVVWTDTAPDILHEDYQQDYLRMTMDSFMVNSDAALALKRWQSLGDAGPRTLEAVSAAATGQEKVAFDGFKKLVESVSPNAPAATDTPGGEPQAETSSTLSFLLIAVVVVVVAAVGYFAFRLLRPISMPVSDEDATPVQRAMKITQSAQQTDYEGMGLATPITQSMTTYVLGDDLYDESFSIESQAGEFMGEYGVGISDTIGVGDPKKVTALEVWLFDKNDIKTATKVLMSEHAFNNPEIRQRLEAKGELVLVQPQQPVKLQTKTLQLLVTIADLEYGSGPLPDRSYFDRAMLELAIWPRSEG